MDRRDVERAREADRLVKEHTEARIKEAAQVANKTVRPAPNKAVRSAERTREEGK